MLMTQILKVEEGAQACNVKVEEESPSYRQAVETERVGRKRGRKRGLAKMYAQKLNLDSNYNYSLWGAEENISYMKFLITNHTLFRCTHNERRLMKVNVLMSQWVKTRSPDQCRSHHQKMMKYHQDIPTIINYIHEYIDLPRIEKMMLEVKLEHQEQELARLGLDQLQVKVEDGPAGYGAYHVSATPTTSTS